MMIIKLNSNIMVDGVMNNNNIQISKRNYLCKNNLDKNLLKVKIWDN